MDLTEATMLALEGKLTEGNTTLNVNDIAKFLESSVEKLQTTDYTCSEYKLDNDLSLFVGWGEGFDDKEDTTIIQSKNNPTFAIVSGIKSNKEYLKTDFDYLIAPYEEETGEVWDTEVSISPNEDFNKLAEYYIEEYNKIREQLDAGALVLESK